MALNIEFQGQGVKEGKLRPAAIATITVGMVLLLFALVWLVR